MIVEWRTPLFANKA